MEGGRGGGGRSREDKGGRGTQPHSLGQLDVSLVVTCLSSQLERDTQKQEKFMWLWVLEAGRGPEAGVWWASCCLWWEQEVRPQEPRGG